MFSCQLFFATAQNGNAIFQDIKTDVVYLASDYCEGRETGEVGETRAAEYIVHRFQEIGLKPKGDDGSWYQSFPFHERVNPHATDPKETKKGTGKNVVGWIDNGAATSIIIGAHYDHLGMGGSEAPYMPEMTCHSQWSR